MNVGIVGLGKMGSQIARKLIKKGFNVVGYDPAIHADEAKDIPLATSLTSLAQSCSVVWLMVPAGSVVDDCITQIMPHLEPNAIVIDGGNSFYKDSIKRAELLASKNIYFLDCGTSGGTHGLEHGFSMMVGGDKQAYDRAEEIFKTLAAANGYGYFGPAGAGHFVKMVHNGIEYGLLQAYAEGFHILRDGPYKELDLAHVSQIWQNGSVVRSWLLSLAHDIFSKDQKLTTIDGYIDENKTGRWALEAGEEFKVPVPVTKAALDARAWSRQTGGNFTTKLVALFRNAFGGHNVKLKDV